MIKNIMTAAVAVVSLGLAACAGPSAGASGGASDTPESITIIDSGGSSGQSIDQAYSAPFTAATGVKVIRQSPSDLGKLQAMVQSGNVTADLVELGGPAMETAHTLGLIEDLDWKAIDPEPMVEEAKRPYAFGYQFFALYMGAREDAKPVKTWPEFWDTTRQPGKRAVPAYARYILPIALLADGVAPDQLYPLDIDRALRSVEKIKDDLVFWENAAQTPQLLKSNEVVYAATWDNVYNKDGLVVNYENGLSNMSFFVVPKGAKHPAQAMRLLHEMSKVDNQVKAASIAPAAGPSPDLMEHLSPEVIASLPSAPEYRKTQVPSDLKWWAEHGDEANKRWSEFMLTL